MGFVLISNYESNEKNDRYVAIRDRTKEKMWNWIMKYEMILIQVEL